MSDSADDSRTARFVDYRERLDAVGFKPSRRLGQNFLLDRSLHRAIVDAAGLTGETVALEIGVGLGFLTRELAVSDCRRVVAVEIDERLADLVEEDATGWPGAEGRLEIVRSDALGAGGRLAEPVLDALARSLADPGARGFAVVANLPYATSGPLLAALVRSTPRPPDTIVALVQRELAERLAAGVGHPERGGLTVLLECFYEAEIVRKVGREVFRPRPNVDSAVVRLRIRADGAIGDERLRDGLAEWIRALFGQRRKTLNNAVRAACRQLGLERPELSEEAGRQRAEEWGAAAHRELFDRVLEANPSRRDP